MPTETAQLHEKEQFPVRPDLYNVGSDCFLVIEHQ